MRLKGAAAGVIVLLLASCGGGNDEAAEPSTTRPALTAPAPEVATARQVASVVAQSDVAARDALEAAGPCFFIGDPDCTPAAAISMTTLGLVAESLTIGLSGIDEAIADEVAELTADTLAASEKLDGSIDAWVAGECLPGPDGVLGLECEAITAEMFASSIDFERALDAWRPYIG